MTGLTSEKPERTWEPISLEAASRGGGAEVRCSAGRRARHRHSPSAMKLSKADALYPPIGAVAVLVRRQPTVMPNGMFCATPGDAAESQMLRGPDPRQLPAGLPPGVLLLRVAGGAPNLTRRNDADAIHQTLIKLVCRSG